MQPAPADMLCRHNPPESVGDCMRACLATLLGLPSAEVPHLALAPNWYQAALDFLRPRGLALVSIDFPAVGDGPWPGFCPPGMFVMAYGKGVSSGVPHAVVCRVTESRGLEVWHDPNPSREGIVPGSLDGVAFLVPCVEG